MREHRVGDIVIQVEDAGSDFSIDNAIAYEVLKIDLNDDESPYLVEELVNEDALAVDYYNEETDEWDEDTPIPESFWISGDDIIGIEEARRLLG